MALLDRHHRLRRIPRPFVVFSDGGVIVLLAASIAYDILRAYSHFEEGHGPGDGSIRDDAFDLIYVML